MIKKIRYYRISKKLEGIKMLNHSHYRPEVSRGFQEIKILRLRDNGSGMVVSLSALRTGRFYPQKILLVLICIRG